MWGTEVHTLIVCLCVSIYAHYVDFPQTVFDGIVNLTVPLEEQKGKPDSIHASRSW